jgi:2-oxoglutarate dehydrogenase E2 component (dihydrolipoamide succinyltransferase)
MIVEIKIPNVGESVKEALLAEWFKTDGDTVTVDEPLFVIETDKVTLEVVAEAAGALKITVEAGATVAIGTVVGNIDASAAPIKTASAEKPKATRAIPAPELAQTEPPQGAAALPHLAPSKAADSLVQAPPVATPADSGPQILAPSVRRLVAEKGLNPVLISGTGPGGRITKTDVILYLEKAPRSLPEAAANGPVVAADGTRRVPVSPIRRRIAARLVAAKQQTAMLTTFNEIDMSQVMAIRSQHKEAFKKKHGINLGMMSFFIKACVAGLIKFPQINAFIENNDFVYHDYVHIGVAIGSGRGLVVPVIRHAEQMSYAEIEQAIVDYINKVKNNRIELADLEGGTFTISNGGVYGSLLSTPILNMPQSAILGMHKIEKRPIVIDDEIVVRPMMYVALSYDHRVIDGREAVSFLVNVKEGVENPKVIQTEI